MLISFRAASVASQVGRRMASILRRGGSSCVARRAGLVASRVARNCFIGLRTEVPSQAMVAGLNQSGAGQLERPKRSYRRPRQPLKRVLSHGAVAVAFVAVVLTGAATTLLFWRDSGSAKFHSREPDRFTAAFAPFVQQGSFQPLNVPDATKPAASFTPPRRDPSQAA